MELDVAGLLIIEELARYLDWTAEAYVDTVYVAESRRDREVGTNLGEPVLDVENVFRLGIERVVVNRFYITS